MKIILTEHAKEGQTLAREITRHDGVLLANKGTELTESLLKMLERLNIETVCIETGISISPEELEANFLTFQAELDKRFSKVENNTTLMFLKKTMLDMAEQEKNESLEALNNSEDLQ